MKTAKLTCVSNISNKQGLVKKSFKCLFNTVNYREKNYRENKFYLARVEVDYCTF